jgi:hypothetical protein
LCTHAHPMCGPILLQGHSLGVGSRVIGANVFNEATIARREAC